MPRSGGVYTLPPGYFATDGTTIEVSQHNPPLEDIAQALTDSMPRDGSAPMTGNLPMGGNKITGGAVGTNPTDFALVSQLPTVTPTTATLTAGTDAQGQGPITTDQVTITTAAANPSGVTLPTAVAGDRVIIANRGANPVNIYPATGAAIGALATNAPVLLAVNQSVEFFARSATQWEGQISQPLDADVTAYAALSTTGLVARTGSGTAATRQITSTDGSVIVTNPDGVAGNINLEVAGWTYGTPVATTSGTTVTISTAIPAGVTDIEVLFDGVSLDLTDAVQVQLGTGGSFVTTGYVASGIGISGDVSSTAGFPMRSNTAARALTGKMGLTLFDPASDKWVADHSVRSANDNGSFGGGSITLAGDVDRIRLAILGAGGSVFDAGNVNIRYR
jgi:hypothetical protein